MTLKFGTEILEGLALAAGVPVSEDTSLAKDECKLEGK